jgi:hypothetical protein
VKKHAAEVIRTMFDVPDCRAVLRLDKEVRHPERGNSSETRYFISSLDPDTVSASEFQSYILGHWEVENCLHLPKDRDFGEDEHVCGDDWGVAFCMLMNMAVSLSGLLRQGERTLKEVREKCAANPTNTAIRIGLCRETC